MIEDVYEPLALYRDRFKAEYAKHTATFFEELVKRSGVDERANADTVKTVRELEKQIVADSSTSSRWKLLRTVVVMLVVAAFAGLGFYIAPEVFPDARIPLHVNGLWAWVCVVVATAGILLTTKKLTPKIHLLNDNLRVLNERLNAKMHEAWQQLAPLNRLYDWGMFAQLIQQTVPRLALDPYFSHARLDELQRSFGWSDRFNQDKSVIFAQSGEINGNPFVIAETLDFQMGTQAYQGSLPISWKERVKYTDSNGHTRTRWVTRTQTLHASVTKPAPRYHRKKCVIYGNEAAPKLTFSRTPSALSSLDRNAWSKRRTVKKLEKFSRNLDDDYGFTLMSNHDFEALFHATDRNNEVQFRLLFSPFAQLQMVNLLRDNTVGFGDNFTFVKDHRVNVVWPEHLTKIDISAAPSLFHKYELADARSYFNNYSNNYFRAFYFALAPLLTIPLYQQHRSHGDIYKDVIDKTASFWEHESIANFYGQAAFKHPSSVTENILKTRHTPAHDGSTTVDVTAHGYRGQERTEYVSERGGDGRWHEVPVRWIDYLPVQRTSSLVTRETQDVTQHDFEQQANASNEWQAFFQKRRVDPKHVMFRRSIVSFLIKSK